jgi:arylsulfatase A-like enzyme
VRPRLAVLLVALAVPPLLVHLFFVARRARRPPNIVVVVADTLRADRLGAYGNRRGLTPFLDELAARGTTFTNAYAASSWTCPSVASLFTSRYPSEHGVSDFDSKVPESEVTLAERLGELRYISAGFSANLRLARPLGYGQGFTGWFPFATRDKLTTDRLGRKSLLWLDQAWNRRARRPLFLYYQLMETHGPYEPEAEAHAPDRAIAPLRRRICGTCGAGERAASLNALLTGMHWDALAADDVAELESLYDAEVASLDTRLRALFTGLASRGVLDKAIVVFTADHGEEFRDHGALEHGTSLFNELVRVPLIVLTPGQRAGRVVRDNVSLVDVAPTVLEMVGVDAGPAAEGRSLVPLLAGASVPADVVAELPPVTTSGGDPGRHDLAFVRGTTKLIVPRGDAGAIVYDLASDPGEQRPEPARRACESCLHAAQRRVEELRTRAAVPEHAVVDERMRDRLRALGYVN